MRLTGISLRDNVTSKPVAYYIITKKMFVSISDVNNIVNVPELESKAKYKSEQDGLLCSINDLMSAASAAQADISTNRIKLLTSIIDEASSVMNLRMVQTNVLAEHRKSGEFVQLTELKTLDTIFPCYG